MDKMTTFKKECQPRRRGCSIEKKKGRKVERNEGSAVTDD